MGAMAIQRYLTSIVTGVVITFALLWIMQWLIATGKDAITEKRDFNFVDFVRVKKDETLNREDPKPKKPRQPEQPPPESPPKMQDNIDAGSEAIAIGAIDTSLDLGPGGTGSLNVSEGEYLPIARINPIYPRRAMQRGIEGYCIVTFTVTKLGTVDSPSIVECSSSLFERASLKAVQGWKYKPRVRDGVPYDVPGVETKLTYQLEQ